MKVRTPDKALADMALNLCKRSAINAAFAEMQLFDENKIEGFATITNQGKIKSNFDYIGFIFSDAFRPDIHLQKNQKRIWPLLEAAFLSNECHQFQFNYESCGSKIDKNTVRRAIILCAMIDSLEAVYFKTELQAQTEKHPEMSNNKFQGLQNYLEKKCRPFTRGKILYGKLDQLMQYVMYLEKLELLTASMRLECAPSKKLSFVYVAEIISRLYNCKRVLDVAEMESVVAVLNHYVKNPTLENAKNCAEKARYLYDSVDHAHHHNMTKVIDKLYLIAFHAECEYRKQLQSPPLDAESKKLSAPKGMFNDRDTQNKAAQTDVIRKVFGIDMKKGSGK